MTSASALQSAKGAGIIPPKPGNYRSFLDIYDFVGRSRAPPMAAKRTISSDGLDTFKPGYELVRDEIGMRRDNLNRHAGHEDNAGSEASALDP